MGTQSAQLAIVDVGHGACAVVATGEHATVIDAGSRNNLLIYLREAGIRSLDAVLISHADEDHIGGVIGLLSSGDVKIGKIRLNSDAMKASKIWDDLLYELSTRDEKRQIDFQPVLARSGSHEFDLPGVRIEVLSPSKYLAARGPGSIYNGRKVTTNSISAVVRVSSEKVNGVLFVGDLDGVGLEDALRTKISLRSAMLVYPHHGGHPGSDEPGVFAAKICDAVKPTHVVFSIGRSKHDNPLPEVVQAIRASGTDVRILCTQLSVHCSPDLPRAGGKHLASAYAAGRERHLCCAGTVVVDLVTGDILPTEQTHLSFIDEHAATPLCGRPKGLQHGPSKSMKRASRTTKKPQHVANTAVEEVGGTTDGNSRPKTRH